MRHLSAVMALSFMATSAFAATVVDFVERNGYTTSNEKLESDQTSWSSWIKNNGALKTTIKGDKFSAAVVVPYPECDYGYQHMVVNYSSNCGDDNNVAAYGYDPYYPTDPWYEIGSFKSGQDVNVQCDAYTKIALQAQTSSGRECDVSISSIYIGSTDEVVVTGATVPKMSDYKKSGDSISLSIPFKSRLDSIKPTFSGYFGSVSPSTAQDFTDGPVTYTFTAKSGTETQTIVLSIAKLPGDSNAKASGVGFCKLAKTESGLTKAELIAKGNICTEGSEVVHPKASGDTGTITFNIYKWAPDSVKTRLYGRYDSQKRNAGVAKGNLASMAWYYKGEAMENVTDETPFDIENTVLKVTAEAGYPIFYYKLKLQGVDPKNFLYQIVMVDTVATDNGTRERILRCSGQKNLHGISEICREAGLAEGAERPLLEMLGTYGSPRTVMPAIRRIAEENGCGDYARELGQAVASLMGTEEEEHLWIDFSATEDLKYYNGIAFKGFLEGIPDPVLSGGQYDALMRRMHRKDRAVGFAVFLHRLDRLNREGGAN